MDGPHRAFGAQKHLPRLQPIAAGGFARNPAPRRLQKPRGDLHARHDTGGFGMARQKPRFAPYAQCLHGQIHVRTVFFQQFVDEALADVKTHTFLRCS